MNTSVQQQKKITSHRKKLLPYMSTKAMKQRLEPEPISTSHFITQAEIKIPAGGQEERRKIDIPILPCLFHLPPTLSHIIAVDTGETKDSHVKNMGRRGEWQLWCAVGSTDGTRDVRHIPNICTDSSKGFAQLTASKIKEKAWVCWNNRKGDCLWGATRVVKAPDMT